MLLLMLLLVTSADLLMYDHPLRRSPTYAIWVLPYYSDRFSGLAGTHFIG
ncbi:hypothetical protein KOR42_30600 [Thalassoglobus neptunius]|uniref:Uncharacterized protein n=1 Tax=Thalassoglobus neptunius TaxID=1938619 RepID=A0A5C5WQW9_9PLAN|nr:hypothetical protein KOR42_30600 [Thalassoglobus neptunius]